MRRRIPKTEAKRGKTLFLAKKRGDADNDLVKPAAAELSKVTGILSGTLMRRNSWNVTEESIRGRRKEPFRNERSVTRELLFTVKYDTENEVHFDLWAIGNAARTILDAGQEAVFVFKGHKTCDDSYGIVKFSADRKRRMGEMATLSCKGWVKKEMSGSV